MIYGLPYRGSKSGIAEKLLAEMPIAENFVDLFGGGGAMCHCAALSGKYQHIIMNDIQSEIVNFFQDVINGKYKNEKRWISREDFYREKDRDAFVKICWSFGNNGDGYMYGEEIEPWKKALHFAVVFNDESLLNAMEIYDLHFNEESLENRRLSLKRKVKDEHMEKYKTWYFKNILHLSESEIETIKNSESKIKEELRQYLREALKQSGLNQSEVNRYMGTQMAEHYFGRSQWGFPTREAYEKLKEILPLNRPFDECVKYRSIKIPREIKNYKSKEELQNLEALQRLKNLSKLSQKQKMIEFLTLDYSSVPIPPNSVIYCDIPYEGTKSYFKKEFDYHRFFEWTAKQTQPIFISSYKLPAPFVCVYETKVQQRISASSKAKREHVTERLFTLPKFLTKIGQISIEEGVLAC